MLINIPTTLVVTPLTNTVDEGGTVTFTATGNYTDGNTVNLTKDVTWTSSSSAASVSPHGVATGLAVGTATIKATFKPPPQFDPTQVPQFDPIQVLPQFCRTLLGGGILPLTVNVSAQATLTVTAPVADAGVDSGKGGLCSRVDISLAPIVAGKTIVGGTPPRMMGGPIVPGNYTLTDINDYIAADAGFGSSSSLVPMKEIAVFGKTTQSFDSIHYTTADGGGAQPETVVGSSYTTNGTTLSYAWTCGTTGSGTEGYTATQTGLVLSYTSPPPFVFTQIVTFTLNRP